MKISNALQNVQLLYVETAPFIYFVEKYPAYIEKMHAIFQYANRGDIDVLTSTITLTEVLTKPLKHHDHDLEANYLKLFLNTRHVRLITINQAIAQRAAQLRAAFNLKTPDALQVASALETNCHAFLTNDSGIKRVTDINVLMIDELELSTEAP